MHQSPDNPALPFENGRALPDPKPDPKPQGSSLILHIGLFVTTSVTTIWAGYLAFGSWRGGFDFGATLMAILVCHEMGHYVVARRHGIEVSLPYFVPLPPQISLGTLGAIIRMRQPIADRNQLLDVGAAGPLFGLCVALVLLVIGLLRSPLGTVLPGSYLEGNSLVYIAIKYAVFGQYLPAPDGTDVHLEPMAFAAWVGLIITMINLIPIGQLDGGHVACAVLGEKHESSSRWLHKALVFMAALVAGSLIFEGWRAGLGVQGSVWHGIQGGLPWLVWALILLIMRGLSGGSYHPPVISANDVPLTRGRRMLGWIMLVVFLGILTPVPFRPAV